MKRRIVVGITLSLLAALAVFAPARADHHPPVAPDVFPKISAIVNPLGGAPAILEFGDTLRIEIDPAFAPSVATATLIPSFGAARTHIGLPLTSGPVPDESVLWPGRTVAALLAPIPASSGSFVEDLYDLRITWNGGSDVQHRAVKVVHEIPASPRFVIIADPSVGDPRPVQEGAEDLAATGSSESLTDKTLKTVGNPMDGERWGALVKAIHEVNLVQPDFVLVTGDLTFGAYPRPANVEYEDAYRILNTLRVPSFLSPGNHDLYNVDYDNLDRPHTTDGLELWQRYFAPLHYSVDVGEDLHIVSLNTFDWPKDLRQPFASDGSTRSGGQLSNEQLAWAEADMTAYRDANPDGAIVTFAHHDPSWRQRRHPWPGINRLPFRKLLKDVGAYVHFAGHTHEDRVARYHQGNVVETNGQNSFALRELHYVKADGDAWDQTWSQETLGEILHDHRHGPLFVTTTTAASGIKGPDWGLGSYWGWRLGTMIDRGGGYDPVDFGYPATQAFIDATAERPDRWNPAHAQFGVFSYPSFHIDEERDRLRTSRTSESVTLTSRLLVPLEVLVPMTLEATEADAIAVSGGTLERRRSWALDTDVWVRTTIPAGGSVTVTATLA